MSFDWRGLALAVFLSATFIGWTEIAVLHDGMMVIAS